MRLRYARLAAAALGFALLVGPLAAGAHAHERRTVGTVQMVVGWLNEPAFSSYLNAVQLRVTDDAGPITDVGDGLTVEVAFGDQKVGPLALRPAFGSPGEYRAPMIPSRAGVYTFRFVGTVRGQAVDASFTSSDTTFDSPREPAEIEFPVKDPSRAQLATRLERVEPRIDEAGAAAASEAADAQRAASRSTLLALAGLAAGVGGLAVGVTARRARRVEPATPAQPPARATTGS